jgi:hypothetical protein
MRTGFLLFKPRKSDAWIEETDVDGFSDAASADLYRSGAKGTNPQMARQESGQGGSDDRRAGERVRGSSEPDLQLEEAKLRRVFGKDKVTMFEMNKHLPAI